MNTVVFVAALVILGGALLRISLALAALVAKVRREYQHRVWAKKHPSMAQAIDKMLDDMNGMVKP